MNYYGIIFFKKRSLDDIYNVRKLMEPKLAASVAEHPDEEDLQLLEKSAAHCSLHRFEGNDRAQRIQELDFHLVMADA